MTITEEQIRAIEDYLSNMETHLEQIIGAEMLDRYIHTNLVYIGYLVDKGEFTGQAILDNGLAGLEPYL